MSTWHQKLHHSKLNQQKKRAWRVKRDGSDSKYGSETGCTATPEFRVAVRTLLGSPWAPSGPYFGARECKEPRLATARAARFNCTGMAFQHFATNLTKTRIH